MRWAMAEVSRVVTTSPVSGVLNTYGTRLLAWLRDHKALRFLTQSVPDAARTSIHAVTTELPSGTYLAPRFKLRGKPMVAKPPKKARDPAMARRLWDRSAELTGCDWQH
jgi:hypothetical protein